MASLSNCYTPLPASAYTNNTNNNNVVTGTTRLEQRSNRALRQLFMSTDILSQSDGSCLLELGHTKVLCAVFGPRSSSSSIGRTTNNTTTSLHCEVRYAPSWGKNTTGSTMNAVRSLNNHNNNDNTTNDNIVSPEELEWSARLHSALLPSIQLQNLQQCSLDVIVMILQADGSILPATIAAASLALSDANVELHDLVTSCSVCVCNTANTNTDNMLLLLLADPTLHEEEQSKGTVTLSMLANSKDVCFWQVSGRLDTDTIQRALDLCKDGCHTMHRFMRDCLVKQQQQDGSSKNNSNR